MGGFVSGVLLLVYWGVAGWALYMALTRPKTIVKRVIATVIVLLLVGVWPAMEGFQNWKAKQYKEAALAHFRKLCAESAGERIYQIVDNVEAIFLANPRPVASEGELRDQYWMGDPYGYSSFEARYPAFTYLRNVSGELITGEKHSPIRGYKYVEMPNSKHRGGQSMRKYVRYSLLNDAVTNSTSTDAEPVIPEEVDRLKSKYGVRWEDNSTPQERADWIAASKLTIFELETGAVIAERLGYVIDPYFGQTGGGRSIWLHVNNVPSAFCPRFEHEFYKNKQFVARVLRPK